MDPEDEMRSLVGKVSAYARDRDPDFVVIVANGEDLALDGDRTARGYLDSIDGVAREDLFFGWNGMDSPTPWTLSEKMAAKLNVSKAEGKAVMAVDRCSQRGYLWDSTEWAKEMGFLYFGSDSEGLASIPEYPADPPMAHTGDVRTLAEARNHMVLTAARGWDSREDYLEALQDTNYDVLVIDAYFNDTPLTPDEVDSLRTKRSGGQRLVVAVIGLGEVDERQQVWKDLYLTHPPGWLGEDVDGRPGRHHVKYWGKSWRSVMFRSEDSWLDTILDAGFDGVYMMGGDAHLAA